MLISCVFISIFFHAKYLCDDCMTMQWSVVDSLCLSPSNVIQHWYVYPFKKLLYQYACEITQTTPLTPQHHVLESNLAHTTYSHSWLISYSQYTCAHILYFLLGISTLVQVKQGCMISFSARTSKTQGDNVLTRVIAVAGYCCKE